MSHMTTWFSDQPGSVSPQADGAVRVPEKAQTLSMPMPSLYFGTLPRVGQRLPPSVFSLRLPLQPESLHK